MVSPSWVDVEGNLSLMRSLEVFDVLGFAVFLPGNAMMNTAIQQR